MPKVVRAAIHFYRRSHVRPLKRPLLKALECYRMINRNKTVLATVDGINYELDLNETIDAAIYYEGCFEPYTTEAIRRLCKPGTIVVDVGANVGCHTLRFAQLVGPRGRVVAFEPMSQAFARLKKNVELNVFGNIMLERMALSNHSRQGQKIRMACSWPLYGVDDVHRHPLTRGRVATDIVDFVTLDEYVRAKDVARIDLIKVDVEGHEFKVLQGAVETLRAFRPVIIMELGISLLAEAGDSLEAVVSFLSALGYAFYAERGLERLEGLDAIRAAIPQRATMNVILSMNELPATRIS
jgi:FkbM family methyltransferase